MQRAMTTGVLAAACAGLLSCTAQQSASPPDAVSVRTALRQPIAPQLAPGREAILQEIEIPPHSSIPRHWHPGEEYLYCLEGEAEVVIDGRPPMTLTPGMGINLPYRVWHSASTGDSPCKVIVFRVHTQGEPIMHVEGEASP